METIPLEPVDGLSITTLVDNFLDIFLPDQGPARRLAPGPSAPRLPAATLEGGVAIDSPLAEHGFSAMVTVRRGDSERRMLFDAGITPDGLTENMRRLGISPKDLEIIVLSHGHFDHTTGMDGLVRAIGRANVPVIIHPAFWTRRRIALPGRDPFELPSTSRSALQGNGFEVIESVQPSFLLDRSVLITGEVDRTTGFEKGFPMVHQALRGGGWEPDPLILDDQALVAHVRDKGLVVLTGCGHSGLINILRYVRTLTGIDRIHAVIGGFHLNGPLFEPIIPQTLDGLAAFAPEVLVPAHCTGWRAVHAIAARFPDAFIQNSVGTRFEL